MVLLWLLYLTGTVFLDVSSGSLSSGVNISASEAFAITCKGRIKDVCLNVEVPLVMGLPLAASYRS